LKPLTYDVLNQETSQHLYIEMLVNSLALWSIIMVHNTFTVEENNQHHFCFNLCLTFLSVAARKQISMVMIAA